MHVENLVTNIKICMINKDFPFELTIVPTTFIRNLNMNKITYFFVISSRGERERSTPFLSCYFAWEGTKNIEKT